MLKKIVFAALYVVPFCVFGQGINGGFEHLAPNGLPIGWTVADPGGAAISKDAYLGKVAAKAWVYKNYEPGTWNHKLDLAEGNASEVSGYYKYIGSRSECENATVSYLMGMKTAEGKIDTIAYGGTELKLEKDYTKFALSITSTGSGTPDFINLQIQPSGHCNIHGETNCCFLFVDDIVLGGRVEPTESAGPVENEGNEGTKEKKSKKGKKKEAEMEAADSTAGAATPIIENKVGEPTPTTPAEPVKEEAPVEKVAPQATPVEEKATEEAAPEEEAVPEEEESTEPVDEEWDSEEESSDGGR